MFSFFLNCVVSLLLARNFGSIIQKYLSSEAAGFNVTVSFVQKTTRYEQLADLNRLRDSDLI